MSRISLQQGFVERKKRALTPAFLEKRLDFDLIHTASFRVKIILAEFYLILFWNNQIPLSRQFSICWS